MPRDVLRLLYDPVALELAGAEHDVADDDTNDETRDRADRVQPHLAPLTCGVKRSGGIGFGHGASVAAVIDSIPTAPADRIAAMRVRPATDTDLPLLAEMIVAAAFPPDRVLAEDEALRAPHVVPWLDGWMRLGDLGVVAEAQTALGAAWCRRFTGDEPGASGFVDVDTPVVAIAVRQAHRGGGIGTALLDALIAAARDNGWSALSLSVARANPALRLYERLGFQRLDGDLDRPLRLRRAL